MTDETASESERMQIDAYGIRWKIAPSDPDPAPKTWIEVWNRVHATLMAVVTDSFGVVGDTLSGTRVLIRGIARIPSALAERIDTAHKVASEHENNAEQGIGGLKYDEVRASSDVTDILSRLHERGVPAKLINAGNGNLILVIGNSIEEQSCKSIVSEIENHTVGFLPDDSGSSTGN